MRRISTRVASCNDLDVKDTYLKGVKGLTLIKEVGHPILDTRFSLSDKDVTDPLDIAGSETLRTRAVLAMIHRYVGSTLHMEYKYYPNMVDEPDIRQLVTDKLLERATVGVDLTQYLDGEIADGVKALFANFDQERPIIEGQFELFKYGFSIPGSEVYTHERNHSFLCSGNALSKSARQLPQRFGHTKWSLLCRNNS